MRIAIATVQVPFIHGGAEVLAENLQYELNKRGHNAEIVTIPFKNYPADTLLHCMEMGRQIDLSASDGQTIDKVIALKFPAFYLKHENKVVWLLHQYRTAYDLWDNKYSDLKPLNNGEQIREFIHECDKKYLPEAKKIFTISQNVSNRLFNYCGIDSKVLYHPPKGYERLYCENFGDYIFYPSRINPLKRQELLVDAAKYLHSNARILLSGGGTDYENESLRKRIRDNDVEDRVTYVGFISDEQKISYYANCLAVYFGTLDEDYGYITLEGMFSGKPVIVHPDAGGPLEFIEEGDNGCIVDADAKALAAKIDDLYENRQETMRLGVNARRTMDEKNMNWDYVIDQLLSE